MNKTKLALVVDDEINMAKIVCAYLEKAGFETSSAYDGHTALALFDRLEPAVVILDLMLPGLSGEEVCAILRKKSRVPVIMLTAKTAEEDALTGLCLGADDYVRKPFSPRELIARVDAVMRRSAAEAAPLFTALSYHDGDLTIDTGRHEARIKGVTVPLTPTEFSILSILAGHPTRVFTRGELITLAIGDDYDGFDRVIDTHIKNLRQKIEHGGRKYIKTVHGIGYTFCGE